MSDRTFVIGDIHGALKALVQLVDKLQLAAGDRLIFLGDYVDGWPESAPLIDYLMELQGQYACVFIRGNHDIWCQDWLSGKEADPIWLHHGGRATVQSYEGYSRQRKMQHLEFFERMHNYFTDDDNRLFIHAGFASMHGPHKEPYASNYSWDRTLWETARCIDPLMARGSALYPKRLMLFKEIFIGHTPTLHYTTDVPMQGANVFNIDTGAAFHGRLSAMDVNSKQYLQSDIVQQLYPEHTGRHL